jgi:hypothetical protein
MIAKIKLVLHHLALRLMPQRLKISNYIFEKFGKTALLAVSNSIRGMHYERKTKLTNFRQRAWPYIPMVKIRGLTAIFGNLSIIRKK